MTKQVKKPKLAMRVYEYLFGKPERSTRRFAAGRLTRANADWGTTPTSINRELREDLPALRARARQASHDNPYFKKFLSLVRENIVGAKGMQLQSRARLLTGELDVELNKQVEEAWWQWTHRETCTASGRLDWLGVQRLAVTRLACDGEFLIQKVYPSTRVNPFGFALKFWDVNWLDEMYNDTLPGGNRVRMSVEIDDMDRPVAYWLTTPASDMMFAKRSERTRTRIPADQMIHGFLSYDDETQVRGVTWFSASLLTARNLQSYCDGVINAARLGAHQIGFLTQQTPDGEQFTGAEDEAGNPIVPSIDVSPLSMNALPEGWDIKQFDPKHPTQNHAAFAKTVLMELSTGVDLPYFELSGDMEAVNYSSARVGLDNSREIWRGLQDFVAMALCREVFHGWAKAAFLGGSLDITAAQFAEIQNPVWRGRGWKYIDPVKDIGADVTALENNLTTWTDVLGERGIDLVDYLERRQSEIKLAKTYGIDLTIQPKAAAPQPEPPPDDTADEPPPKRYINGHDPDTLVN